MSLIKSIGGKNVNFDFNKEFLSIFSDKIKASDIKFINQTLADLHPSDVANLIENLSCGLIPPFGVINGGFAKITS